ncbi:MAG TPA: FG-GAP-like repeat-containing protein [Bryobacteraceae bacterium]|nr:FG-GAP-like repeat-containing protein [Bryobacteraceae bacterium]
MNQERAFAMAALSALALLASFAPVGFAQGPNFTSDSTFKGSSLGGWHVLGQADWSARNGELTGKAKQGGSGGWLVLDEAYQDIGFYAGFRCIGGCQTGVLLRAEKTPNGMKGFYISLSDGDLAIYKVTLDADGKELTRQKLRPAGGTVRFAPSADAPNPAAQRGGSGALMHQDDWNAIQIILDSDILRTSINGAAGGAGGATDDNMAGYGPVALYVGGSGEVRFKDVAFKDLLPKFEPKEKVSTSFHMQRISDFYYAWCAAAADINHDSVLDVVSGPFYYEGPDYTVRKEFTPAQTFNPSNQYASGMMNFAYDFTGDGWPDILMAASRPMWLYVNPKGESRRWDKHLVVPHVTTEVVLLKDVDGDGKPELVYGGDGIVAYAKPDPANPTAPWVIHPVSDKSVPVNIHGLGVGDINGDGRMDVLQSAGWWEQPAKGSQQAWTFHAGDFGAGGAEMGVYDVNGDSLNDVVTSLRAHGSGLAWFEQKRDKGGKISFVQHMIPSDFTEPHGMTFADMDGDGVPDMIVGKRYWSHEESYFDPDPYGPAVLYWYRTVRNPNAPGGAEFVPELVHNRSGVGSHLAAVDLNGDGAVDIITSTDRGTFVFWNTPRLAKR